MQDQFPDVLHSAGLTPHEVGWLQIHAEPVLRAADGRAVAELWLQAAVDPSGGGRVELLDATTGATVGEAPLPLVSRGAAILWRIPLQLPETTSSLRFRVEAPIPEGAERVRAPWKLLDTIELRLPEDDDGPEIGLGLAARLGAVALGAATGEVVVPIPSSGGSMRRPSGMKVHPARARPRDLAADVVAAGPEEGFSAAIEVLWTPGEPLDGEALRQRLRAHRSAGPTCPACGAEVVPGAEFCPRCLGPVAAAASASSPHGASVAPASGALPPLEQAPAPEAAHCALHPERASTGACGRCGSFFCDECASAGDPELCAACEAKQPRPGLLGQQRYRAAALVHGLLAIALAVRPILALMLDLHEDWSPLAALPFALVAGLLRAFAHVGLLLAAIGLDALALVEAFWNGDWSLLVMTAQALALTAMLWQRLSSLDSSPAREETEGPSPSRTE